MEIEKLQLSHVYDFLHWGAHENPLLLMYDFVEEENDVPLWYSWKVANKRDEYFAILEEGVAIGYMDLRDFRLFDSKATLGIVIDPAFVGQGIGTKALTYLIDYGFSTHEKLREIELEVYPWNLRAISVYEKLGFVQRGLNTRFFSPDIYEKITPHLGEYEKYFIHLWGIPIVKVAHMVLGREKWQERLDEI